MLFLNSPSMNLKEKQALAEMANFRTQDFSTTPAAARSVAPPAAAPPAAARSAAAAVWMQRLLQCLPFVPSAAAPSAPARSDAAPSAAGATPDELDVAESICKKGEFGTVYAKSLAEKIKTILPVPLAEYSVSLADDRKVLLKLADDKKVSCSSDQIADHIPVMSELLTNHEYNIEEQQVFWIECECTSSGQQVFKVTGGKHINKKIEAENEILRVQAARLEATRGEIVSNQAQDVVYQD